MSLSVSIKLLRGSVKETCPSVCQELKLTIYGFQIMEPIHSYVNVLTEEEALE